MPDPTEASAIDDATAATDAEAPASAIDGRRVRIAIDAAGPAGDRAFTYRVPPELADLEAGEAVLVEFGRREAVGVVLGPAAAEPGLAVKPVLARVRADGPLLPPLTLALAGWIAEHYLAPPALVVRSMLPPGFLERLELIAELRPAGAAALAGDAGRGAEALAAEALAAEALAAATLASEPSRDGAAPGGAAVLIDPADRAILERLAGGPVAVRGLAAPEGRPALLRRLRAMAADGLTSVEWVLRGAAAGPRFERWLVATEAGRAAAVELAAGRRLEGRPLGPRQRAALDELAAVPGDEGRLGAELAARHGPAALAGLVRRGLARGDVRERPRRPLARRAPGARPPRPTGAPLTPGQAAAVAAIGRAIEAGDPRPILLAGLTGAGKTAVYAEAIARCFDGGRPALLLVPEIALAAPIVDRLRAELGLEVALVHSGLGAGERADEWRRIRDGGVDLVVGTRLAVTAPLADVGLVIVDEEHEAAYKSDRTPRLQARDTALRLAELAGAAAVLGSATPAVETAGYARLGRFERIELVERFGAAPPAVELVDLRAELREGNRGLLSRRLQAALDAIDAAAGEQAILVINRRGTASVVLCRDCGHVLRCRDCDRPLVFHQAGVSLRCHHCGRAEPMPDRCPACRSPRIRFLGGGTQRVEREVRERFPELRVDRLDRDVTERRGAAERVIDDFAAGRIDVLVGTSLVAKGLDVPAVTLVGVVSADVILNLPDARATERTYQLLIQAIGRAGRGERPGLAIVQTYQPEHPVIQAVVAGDAEAFYDAELEERRRFGLPPYGRLVKLTLAMADRDAALAAATAEAARLRELARELGLDVTVSGPAPAYIARRGDRWRWNVVLRGSAPAAAIDGGLDARWSIDVDPDSLL